MILIVGCTTTRSSYEYKLYPGPELPDSELAILAFEWPGGRLYIDGLSASSHDYGIIKLQPGAHHFYWKYPGRDGVLNEVAELRKGVTYIAGSSFEVWGDRAFFWIEDDDGHLIAGSRE
jgi:hypothetical protein